VLVWREFAVGIAEVDELGLKRTQRQRVFLAQGFEEFFEPEGG